MKKAHASVRKGAPLSCGGIFVCLPLRARPKVHNFAQRPARAGCDNKTNTMKKILFLHGFASSGHNGTAIMLRDQLYADDVTVVAPDIPVMPAEAMPFLRQLVADEKPDLIVTASMGGLYGEMLRGIPRVLINPAFSMAKRLTFDGMGHREFYNKREDGAKDFKVDRTMIDQFRELEKQLFKGIDAAEKARVWGLFGEHDKRVNHQKDFAKHYGKEHLLVFDGEHSLNGAVVSAVVLPLVRRLLELPAH